MSNTAGDDLFAGLPSSAPAGFPAQQPNVGLPPQTQPKPVSRKTNRAKTAVHAKPKRASRGAPKWLVPVVAVCGLLVLTGVGAGVALKLTGNSILPPAIAAVFDSADAIRKDTDLNDQKIMKWVDEYLANPKPMKENEDLVLLRKESSHLMARAAVLDPLSVSEAQSLPGSIAGPISETERDALHDKLYERGNNERSFILSFIGTTFLQNDFTREFLETGHVALAESSIEGEQIEIEQIQLLREFNRLAAEIAIAEYGNEKAVASQEEFKTYADALYEPLFDRTTAITEELHQLAERRFQLPKDQVGDRKKFREILYYVNQMRAQVLPNDLALLQSGAEIVKYVGKMRSASGEIEKAAAGIKPDRLAQADAEREQAEAEAERERAERERQAQLAAEQRAAEQRAQEEQMNEGQPADQPDANSLADNSSSQPDRPSGPGDALGGSRGRPPFGSGMGGSRFGGSGRGPGMSGPRGNPNRGNPGQGNFGSGGNAGGPSQGFIGGPSGPRYGGGNRPQPPKIDTTTGVTIKMLGGGSLKASDYTPQLSRTLNCPVNWSFSNGKLTIKLGYTGSLDDVVKLIKFGEVKSVDKENRTITLLPSSE
ncbi:MAG: hypothetical protein AAGG48_15810 [Planctomycetota bacterium]